MAIIKMSVLAGDGELNLRAVRSDGEVVLIIEALQDIVEISVGGDNVDADNLSGQLAGAAVQAAALSEDDGGDSSPGRHDGYIGLDAKFGRWFPQLGRYVDVQPDGQPRNGYPSLGIAEYELAALMMDRGLSVNVWAEGEHGPSSRDITEEVDAYFGPDNVLLPLPGVVYAPGALVRYDGATMEVVRDYGSELGVWLAVAGDYSAGDMLVTDRSLVLPVYEPGDVIEYFPHAYGPDGTGDQPWEPVVFIRYAADCGADYAASRAMLRSPADELAGRLGALNIPLFRTRPVPPAVFTEARGWVADNAWRDLETDDVADLTDIQVAAGIEEHYRGASGGRGWAAFRRDGA